MNISEFWWWIFFKLTQQTSWMNLDTFELKIECYYVSQCLLAYWLTLLPVIFCLKHDYSRFLGKNLIQTCSAYFLDRLWIIQIEIKMLLSFSVILFAYWLTLLPSISKLKLEYLRFLKEGLIQTCLTDFFENWGLIHINIKIWLCLFGRSFAYLLFSL